MRFTLRGYFTWLTLLTATACLSYKAADLVGNSVVAEECVMHFSHGGTLWDLWQN